MLMLARSVTAQFSVGSEAAIDSECVTNDKASPRATEPKNGGGDLLRPTQPPDRLISHDFLHGIGLLGQHGRDHWRVDGSRAHCVDSDAPGCILERRALGKPEHPMLGCVIRGPARQ